PGEKPWKRDREPRSVEHIFTVDASNSRILNFYTPAGFEMLLMSIATPAAERKAPIPAPRLCLGGWSRSAPGSSARFPCWGYHLPTPRPKTKCEPSPAKL